MASPLVSVAHRLGRLEGARPSTVDAMTDATPTPPTARENDIADAVVKAWHAEDMGTLALQQYIAIALHAHAAQAVADKDKEIAKLKERIAEFEYFPRWLAGEPPSVMRPRAGQPGQP